MSRNSVAPRREAWRVKLDSNIEDAEERQAAKVRAGEARAGHRRGHEYRLSSVDSAQSTRSRPPAETEHVHPQSPRAAIGVSVGNSMHDRQGKGELVKEDVSDRVRVAPVLVTMHARQARGNFLCRRPEMGRCAGSANSPAASPDHSDQGSSQRAGHPCASDIGSLTRGP